MPNPADQNLSVLLSLSKHCPSFFKASEKERQSFDKLRMGGEDARSHDQR
jgi:hypothetical protein